MKRFLKKLSRSSFICKLYNALPFNNRIRGRQGNQLLTQGILQNCNVRFYGESNVFEIGPGVRLKDCSFQIRGNNNKIVLKENVFGYQMDVCTEDDGNHLCVGAGTVFSGKIHLACTEGTGITVGENCLFSSEIVFRTGDSHGITDMDGNRINPAADIVFGNHIWTGHRAIVTKGVHIGNNNIIGTGAIVTKSIEESNCVLAGVPAKIVKTGVNWNAQR